MANVALPAVMTEFAIPLSNALWVVTIYTLLFAVLMPTCGYLGDLYGQRRMYLLDITLFTLGSLASGLAPSFYSLLGSRALQGIGVSPTLPAVMAIISRAFSPAQRGRAVGFWALVNGAGHTLGPPLSGLLTQQLGWRTVFHMCRFISGTLGSTTFGLILQENTESSNGLSTRPKSTCSNGSAGIVSCIGTSWQAV